MNLILFLSTESTAEVRARYRRHSSMKPHRVYLQPRMYTLCYLAGRLYFYDRTPSPPHLTLSRRISLEKAKH